MKKLYSNLVLLVLIFSFSSIQAQIIVVEDFEDPNAINTSDFPGWSTQLPPFTPDASDPCEGTQSLSRNLANTGSTPTHLRYITPTTSGMLSTGDQIEVSFEYKIIDETTGNPLAAGTNFGTIELSYSTDGGNTWTVYDTIDQNDLPTSDCSSRSDLFSFPANTAFAWQLDPDWASGDWTIYVDDFMAIEQVPCIEPINVEISSVGYTTATVSWEDVNATAAGNYEVAVCSAPTSPDVTPTFCQPPFGGIQSVTNGDTHLDLTGLNDGQSYYIFVRALCGTSNSEWTPVTSFQTTAIGSECSNPIVATSPLPYTDISHTSRYSSDNYTGNPGGNCGGSDMLDGYEVIYHYTTPADDILSIDVTGLTANNVGVFVYEDCADIGNICVDGAITEVGANLNVNSLFVTGGEDYYIVIASTDGNGNPQDTDYTLTIEGFNCATWTVPNLPSSGSPISFVAGQTLADFNNVGADYGIEPTINGATLQWYTDNNGSIGSPITTPLSGISIQDQDCFWVTQNVNTCESPALQVCFDEFNCNTDLGGITGTTTDSVCDTGTVTMTASANTSNIYWYDSQTGGELVNVGTQYTSPTITQSTSYWVTEVFLGPGTIENQGNPGPTTQNTSSNNNHGLTLDIQQEMTIMDVTVYVAGSGNIELELTSANGDELYGPITYAVTPGSATSPTQNVINLNWHINPADWGTNTYYLRKTSGPAMLVETSPSYPYSLGSGNSITNGANASGTTNNYYYFFDWTVTGLTPLCETSPRTQVTAVVHTTQPTQLSADDYVVCIGDQTTLHATSTDPDYVYTWTGSDGTGPLTGADVQVTLTQNTTYTVNAVNPNTGCSYENEISLEVKGAADLALSPDVEICVGETTKLTAGGVVYNFEENPTGWTTTNNSTVQSGGPSISLADWKVVNSPYGSLGISSSDNSSFYISQVNLLGPNSNSDTRLISPPISMVGVGSASVTFEHYLRHTDVHAADGYLEVRVDGGGWQPLKTYSNDIGGSDFDPFENFVSETVDLSPFVGSTIEISFNLRGEWGWYWAIDNVVITRNFLAGSVSWSPMTDLYFDEAGNMPYTGTSTNEVYFNASQGGTYTYTANLDIVNCSSATADITITVHETNPPTTPSLNQDFLYGETLANLEVTGQNLKYYIMDANGNLSQVSVNTPLVDGMTYYVSQTLNACESETIEIVVSQICSEPSNLALIVASDGNNASQITATWDPPADLAGVQGYRIVISDVSDPNNPVVVHDDDVPLTRNFDIIDDLPCGSSPGISYEIKLYTICDAANGVYGLGGTETFNAECLGTTDFRFEGLTYYPNPTPGLVYFENPLPIEKIEVYDLNGRRVFMKNANATNVPVDFTPLASGTYLVAISVDGAKKVIQVIRE